MKHAHKDSRFECAALDLVHDVNLRLLKQNGGLPDPKGSFSQHDCQRKRSPLQLNKVVDNCGHGKKRGQYFIFMVT